MSTNEPLSHFEAFVHEHRGNESNFESIYTRFEKEAGQLPTAEAIVTKAEVYRQAKEKAGNAWPEFEAFITELERALIRAKE